MLRKVAKRRGGDSNPRELTPCRFSRPVTQIHNDQSGQQVTETGEAVLPACLPEKPEIDPELTRLAEVWTNLPAAMRRGILAMVDSVLPQIGDVARPDPTSQRETAENCKNRRGAQGGSAR
jgi:hypothetical protein